MQHMLRVSPDAARQERRDECLCRLSDNVAMEFLTPRRSEQSSPSCGGK